MKWVRVVGVLTIVCALQFAVAYAASDDLTGTAAFFELGFDARSAAMGGIGITVANNGAGVYHNPALLAQGSTGRVLSGYSKDWSEVSLLHVALDYSRYGMGVLRLSSNDIEETDQEGNVIGTFDIAETAVLAGAGFALSPNVGIGVTAKGYFQDLPEKTGKGVAFDTGVLWQKNGLGVGLIAKNLLGKVGYSDQTKDSFDRKVVLGGSWEGKNMTVGLDVATTGSISVGAEYDLGPVSLRGGAKKQDGWTWTMGLGLTAGKVGIDYAYLAPPYLNGTHRISAVVAF